MLSFLPSPASLSPSFPLLPLCLSLLSPHHHLPPTPPSPTLPEGSRLPLFSPLKGGLEGRLLLAWLDLANSPLVKQVAFELCAVPAPLYFHTSFKFHPPHTTHHTHRETYLVNSCCSPCIRQRVMEVIERERRSTFLHYLSHLLLKQ